jgi:nuclear transport factor 2 (NTF2) superfamily protein
LAYTLTSQWRNRQLFLQGREAIVTFLTHKWQLEHEYRLVKELWGFQENRLAVRFQYEYQNEVGHWFRAYGNEQWEFDAYGLMQRREASINELPITEADRKFRWPLGPRPLDHPGLANECR